jgi:hypothetical protein
MPTKAEKSIVKHTNWSINSGRSVPALCALVAAALPLASPAAVLDVAVSFDHRIVEEALVQQVFTGPDRTAEVFADAIRCNTLVLSDPRVSGGENGRLLLVTDVQANVGTHFAGKCRFSRTWNGVVETEQSAQLRPGVPVVVFRTVDSRLLRADDGENALPRFMEGWMRDYVYPRLDGVSIDLSPAISGIEELLSLVLTDPAGLPGTQSPLPQSVTLAGVHLAPEALVATLSLNVPDVSPDWPPADERPLTDAELAAWDANWQAWDAFATWMIKALGSSTGPELTRALAETLLEARYELRDALARDDRSRDPVRELFLKTWSRLAPLLHDKNLPVPGGEALRFASFVGAGDALQALDQLAPHLGMSISQDALRSMARMISPSASDADLTYDTTVDLELRALLGLGPALAATPSPPESRGRPIHRLLGWLISSAHAAQIDPKLIKRLNSWIPARPEIDSYLQAMGRLLDAIAEDEHDLGKVPDEFLAIYDPLLRATAWQESCWRQNVERDGEIEPIRSSAGSVGLMQINMHVWRGVYDIDQILSDVGYSARAGNEILVHYLVDYAIRKNEHEVTGEANNLARATYAMYNGGPRHLKRYREAKTSPSLKKIDGAFWAKYRAIGREGPPAVRPCLAGG